MIKVSFAPIFSRIDLKSLMKFPFFKKRVEYTPVHKRFVYLDDDITISNLSALESGKIDRIVETINKAEKNSSSLGGGVGYNLHGVSSTLTATSESSKSTILQAQLVRSRTSVSAFEDWLSGVVKKNAIIDYRNESETRQFQPGELIMLNGKIEVSKFETVCRTYIEIVDRALAGDQLFVKMLEGDSVDKTGTESGIALPTSDSTGSVRKREAAKRTQGFERRQRGQQENSWKEQKHILEDLLGGGGSIRGQVIPCSASQVFTMNIGIRLTSNWILDHLGDWSGIYTVIAQIDEIIPAGSKWQTVRIFREMPMTKIEENILNDAMKGFIEPIKPFFDTEPGEDFSAINGPLITLRPVAIYR